MTEELVRFSFKKNNTHGDLLGEQLVTFTFPMVRLYLAEVTSFIPVAAGTKSGQTNYFKTNLAWRCVETVDEGCVHCIVFKLFNLLS